jgi:hypothetical protein
MRANEVVRFHCGDCQIAFDLCVDNVRETEVTGGRPSPILASRGAARSAAPAN